MFLIEIIPVFIVLAYYGLASLLKLRLAWSAGLALGLLVLSGCLYLADETAADWAADLAFFMLVGLFIRAALDLVRDARA